MKIGSNKGFTLIELLIVIAIIGILAVALLPTVLGAPAKGRDAARKAHLSAIVTAIEAANLDKGVYPEGLLCLNTAGVNSATPAALQSPPKLLTYFQGGAVPVDPVGASAPQIGGCAAGSYAYCKTGAPASGSQYLLVANMEVMANANHTNAFGTTALTTPCGTTASTITPPTLTAPTATNGPWTYVLVK